MLKTEYFFASVLILKFPHSANIPPSDTGRGYVCYLSQNSSVNIVLEFSLY